MPLTYKKDLAIELMKRYHMSRTSGSTCKISLKMKSVNRIEKQLNFSCPQTT